MQQQRIYNIGVKKGLERCLEHFEVTDNQVKDCIAHVNFIGESLESRFRTSGIEWRPRAINILMEIITIGTLSRIAYDHGELDVDDVWEAIDPLEKIFNSWVHK